MADTVYCPECQKQGIEKTFKNEAGLVGHLRIVHKIEPEDLPGAKKKAPVEMQQGDDGQTFFPITMWLPADLFSLYFHAKQSGISDHKNIADFIIEYTCYGFKKAHEGYGLTLAQVEKRPDEVAAEEMKVFREQISNLTGLVNKLVEEGVQEKPGTVAKKK